MVHPRFFCGGGAEVCDGDEPVDGSSFNFKVQAKGDVQVLILD